MPLLSFGLCIGPALRKIQELETYYMSVVYQHRLTPCPQTGGRYKFLRIQVFPVFLGGEMFTKPRDQVRLLTLPFLTKSQHDIHILHVCLNKRVK
jgi:hypothetical protein